MPQGGRDKVVKAEGGVEEASLPRPGVVGPFELHLLLASESLDSDGELLELLSKDEIGCDIVSCSLPFWRDCEGLASYLSNR